QPVGAEVETEEDEGGDDGRHPPRNGRAAENRLDPEAAQVDQPGIGSPADLGNVRKEAQAHRLRPVYPKVLPSSRRYPARAKTSERTAKAASTATLRPTGSPRPKPSRPRASWAKWYVGSHGASRCSTFGSMFMGSHIPERKAAGR